MSDNKRDIGDAPPTVGSGSRGAPPHPHPHAVVVVALRTDDRHLQRRIQAVLGVIQTYDEPPNTSAHVFAKYVHELTDKETEALQNLISVPGYEMLNLFDQYNTEPGGP